MALWFWGLGSHKDTRVTWRRWGRGGFFWGRWWRFRWCRFWSQSTGLTRLEKRIGGERNEVSMQEGTIHTESELLRTQRRGCGGRGGGRCQWTSKFPHLEVVGPGWAGRPGAVRSGGFGFPRSRSCSARTSPCRRHCPSGSL